MTQSLSQLYVHLVYSTKNRGTILKKENKETLHSYKAGILKKLASPALLINSMPEHVHILFKLSKNHRLADVVEEVKKQTSKWIKTLEPGYKKFSWQNGYAAFSVSSSRLEQVIKYIKNQEEHHKNLSYREEMEMFMKECDVIEYDKEYFWK